MGKHKFHFRPVAFEVFKKEIERVIDSINFPPCYGTRTPSKYNKIEIHIRGDNTDKDARDEFGSSYNKIPVGNYYLKWYFNGQPKRASNMFFDKNGKFSAPGRFPIAIFQTDMEKAAELGESCELKTSPQLLKLAQYDILQNIATACSKDTAPARYDLFESACLNILKFRELNISNTINHEIRIASRFAIIPKNVDSQGNLINKGSWMHNPRNPEWRGTLTDAFDQGNLDFDQINILFDKLGIILGIASESSGMKGVFVEATPGIYEAKMAYPNKEELTLIDTQYRYHSDILIKEQFDGSKLSLFGDPQKMFAREKSLNHANLMRFINNDQEVKGDGYSFFRHYSYLNRNPELIGKQDNISVKTTYNMIVAFVESDSDLKQILNPEAKDLKNFTADDIAYAVNKFETIDKQVLANGLDMVDCHIKISEEIADQTVALERSMTFTNHESAFTRSFVEIRNKIEKHGSLVISSDTSINLDTHLAYEAKCPCCDNLMSPVIVTESIEGRQFQGLPFAEQDQEDWRCASCGTYKKFELMEHYKQTKQGRPYLDDGIIAKTIRHKYDSAVQVVAKSIDLDSIEESGVALRLDIHAPTDMARIVSPEGAKGFTVPTGTQYLGTIDADLIDPTTGQTVRIRNQQIDAVIPFGAFKGKNTGMTIAFTRYINAMMGTKYCPDIELDEIGDLPALAQKINDIYKTSTIKYTRRAFNPKTNRFETLITDNKSEGYPKVRIGIVNLGVTEINSEFFSVLNKSNSLKASQMTSISYNVMGFNELDRALHEASKETLGDVKNFDKLYHLIHAYKGSPEGNQKALKAEDLRKCPQIMFSPMQAKNDWRNFTDKHQLFTDTDLVNGVSIATRLDGKTPVNLVIPPKNILLSMVHSNFGHRVRLNGAVIKVLEMWSHLVNSQNKSLSATHVNKYRKAIAKMIRGKFGMLARSSAYVGDGVQGKEIADAFIPANTIVIGSDTFWKAVYHSNAAYEVDGYKRFLERVSLPEDDRDAINIFGESLRNPFIWFLMGLNITRVWHPHRANRYMKHKYGESFFDRYPKLRDPKSNAIISSTLDTIFRDQSDSDGDLRQLQVILDRDVQEEMKRLARDMQDYKIVNNPAYPKINKIWHNVAWWHIGYMLKEHEGNTSYGFNPEYEFKVSPITVQQANRAYSAAITAKRSIGLITVSQWMIQQIAGYLMNKNQITQDQFLAVCSFYQTVITQDGCIRSVKHVSGALNVLTIDEIAMNEKVIKDNGVDMTPLDKIMQLIEFTGYGESTQQAFQQVVDFWRTHAQVIDGKIDPQKCTKYGLMIKAASAFIYGSKAGFTSKQDLFEALNFEEIKHMLFYETHKDTIDFINSVPDKMLQALYEASTTKDDSSDDYDQDYDF